MLYVDIDIHHGDGVEEAFYLTDRVMTVRGFSGNEMVGRGWNGGQGLEWWAGADVVWGPAEAV